MYFKLKLNNSIDGVNINFIFFSIFLFFFLNKMIISRKFGFSMNYGFLGIMNGFLIISIWFLLL